MRILGKAVDLAQGARISVARFLGAKGMAQGPDYPDYSTRQKALDVIQTMTNLPTVQRPTP